MKNTDSRRFTAELVENNTMTGKKITCAVAGKYSMKSSITGCILEIGKLWRDDEGNLYIISKFMRKSTFHHFEQQDFHIVDMEEN